jgi:hypothetical protein
VSAFSVLFASNQTLLASGADPENLRTSLGEQIPDIILANLVQDSSLDEGDFICNGIARIKSIWLDVSSIAIVRYASQLEKAKEFGAELALIDGISAERLLAAVESTLV